MLLNQFGPGSFIFLWRGICMGIDGFRCILKSYTAVDICGQLVYMGNWIENFGIFSFHSFGHLVKLFLGGQCFDPNTNSSNNIDRFNSIEFISYHIQTVVANHVEFRNHHLSVSLQIFENFVEPFLWDGRRWSDSGVHQVKTLYFINDSTGCMIYHNRVMGQERQTTNYRSDQIWCDNRAYRLCCIFTRSVTET